jgi:hypothetical protein
MLPADRTAFNDGAGKAAKRADGRDLARQVNFALWR